MYLRRHFFSVSLLAISQPRDGIQIFGNPYPVRHFSESESHLSYFYAHTLEPTTPNI